MFLLSVCSPSATRSKTEENQCKMTPGAGTVPVHPRAGPASRWKDLVQVDAQCVGT